MSADKRSVHTDALATLGTLIDDVQKRDAIHLAVEPIVAAEKLFPSQNVGIVNGMATSKADKNLGIVDPFLKRDVQEGERFWLIVYPRQITSLRHVWEHPDFDSKVQDGRTEVDKSRDWIIEFAESVSLKYNVLMGGADQWLETHDGRWGGEYLSFGGLLEGEYVPDEFWDHYEIVKGIKVETDKRGSFFSCSC